MDDDAIWRKHAAELTRYATALVGPGDAEDVLSGAVERVLRSKGSLGALDEPRPYLFKTVLNEARDTLRRRSRNEASAFEPVSHLPEVRPDVVAAVAALPVRQRAAVYLTYWQDRSIAETARLMGCRPGTVKRYLHLARSKLKEVLEDA